jgi:predicted amidohydrolase
VFDLGVRPVNQIVTIEFDAIARWDVGQVINSAWMEPTPQAREYGFTGINVGNGTLSQVALNRQLTGSMELTKDVARPYMGPNAGALAGTVSAQNAWLLSVMNGTSQAAQSQVIDIFPFYGDGRGTTNNVIHQMTSVSSNHPVNVFYTVADPGSINPDPWEGNRVDYNAAMLFERGRITTIYRKLHLVPFTEHFPYQKQLPWIYNALINADTHFWEKGKEATVFEASGVKFSTPICFEDTFGYLSRDFVLNGAELIVNLSNDAWSASLSAQMQHLSMAVFRAVENRRSMVRSTASGQTCAIDPNGKILAMAAPFTESYLNVEVPVGATSSLSASSLYTRFGDYLGMAFTWAAFLVLIVGLILYIIQKHSKSN